MRFNSIVAIEFSQKPRRAGDEPAGQPGRDRRHQHGEGRDAATRSGRASSATTPTSPAGRSSVNQEVFKSEADTNQRNQAIGYLMYAYGYIKANPLQATDIYTEQCSVSVNAKDLATMAAHARQRRQEPGHRQAGHEGRERPRGAGGDGDRRPLRRLGQVALPHRPARPRAASAAASSPSRPASSASRSSRRRSTRPATACKAQKAIADISNALGGNPLASKPR